jgi:hypothetical protein
MERVSWLNFSIRELILDKFIPEMSTYNDFLLHRLNWCYRGEIEQISWLQNVYGKLGIKLRKIPNFYKRIHEELMRIKMNVRRWVH